MADARDVAAMYVFSQSNPSGPGQGSFPDLLRRVADSLDALGDVQVYDVTFSSVAVDGEAEDDLTISVYYDRREQPRSLKIVDPTES